MILISHRGNLSGRFPNKENSPTYIQEALSSGFDVEIDVWCVEGKWYLGHDEPLYPIVESFLENENLWCHAKNAIAFEKMLSNENIHCFWHENDKRTLTSKGYIWTFIGEELIENSITINPPVKLDALSSKAVGVCSDYITQYK